MKVEYYQIGARVRIAKGSSFFRYQGHHGSGEITEKDTDGWFYVVFDNGYRNLYPVNALVKGLPRTIDRRHEERRKGDRRKQ